MKGRWGARPGVTYEPLTEKEIGTLRALAEGMTPKQIAAETRIKSARTVWMRLHRLRLKLGAFTNYEMMYLVGKKGII
jgi:DNA-binding NarL/FixJ family response regulator